jgi:TonB-dependent Receptor Plug Domain
MNRINRALLGASIAAIAFAGQAHAQTTNPSDAEQTQDAGDIVVTANKREQRLNDVGTTVAVLSGDALQNRQINSLEDLANATPGLSFTNSANGTPVYTLRGVGFYETSLGAYPTVSTYVDEAPLPFPVLSSHSAFDLERVEILKGPQGSQGLSLLFLPVMPLIDTCYTGTRTSNVVQHSLCHLKSNAQPLRTCRQSPAQVVESPRRKRLPSIFFDQ